MLSLPLIMLGYGRASEQRLYSLRGAGHVTLPMFTDPAAAERFRAYANRGLERDTLPISATGRVAKPEQINAVAVKTASEARDLLDLVAIVGGVTHVAINPPPLDECVRHECLEFDEIMTMLGKL